MNDIRKNLLESGDLRAASSTPKNRTIKKNNQAANQVKRAEECRKLKDARNSNRK